MDIMSFVYCEDAVNDQSGKNVIIGPLQMFAPINLPSNYSFVVSFGLYDFDKDGGNKVKVVFKSPNNEDLAESVMDLPPLPEEARNSKTPIGVQINISFRNVVLKEPGQYKTEVSINDNLLGSYPINVVYGN